MLEIFENIFLENILHQSNQTHNFGLLHSLKKIESLYLVGGGILVLSIIPVITAFVSRAIYIMLR
jgi:hypothetical protein